MHAGWGGMEGSLLCLLYVRTVVLTVATTSSACVYSPTAIHLLLLRSMSKYVLSTIKMINTKIRQEGQNYSVLF